MDVVITYVDNTDSNWLLDYNKYKHLSSNKYASGNIRFKPYNNLLYCLRSIDANMSFIRKVHLIVSSQSQVPKWINTTNVNIVYHKDIIPNEYLPTFNSRTIEMCMHNIPDLDEEFVYFNDDMYILNKSNPEDFFINGKPVLHLLKYTSETISNCGRSPLYLNCHKRCNEEIQQLLNLQTNDYFITDHGTCALLKSKCKELYSILEDKILPTLTKFRTENDYIHFMYSIYLYYTQNCINDIENVNLLISDEFLDITQIKHKLYYSDSKRMCLNNMGNEFSSDGIMREADKFFNNIFPNACKYEREYLKIGLCTIVKNDNKYLDEFIQHYINLGFNNIYIYDNNDIDGENVKDITNKYNNVTVINYKGKINCQYDAYNDCLETYKQYNDWIAFFDIDEFLELTEHNNIHDFFKQSIFKNFTSIAINWLCYGDNEHVYFENKPVQERFKIPLLKTPKGVFEKYTPLNNHIKCICKTKTNSVFLQSINYPNNSIICNTIGKKIIKFNSNEIVYNKAILKKYITKSTEEYLEKITTSYNLNTDITNEVKTNYINRYFLINTETQEKKCLLNSIYS